MSRVLYHNKWRIFAGAGGAAAISFALAVVASNMKKDSSSPAALPTPIPAEQEAPLDEGENQNQDQNQDQNQKISAKLENEIIEEEEVALGPELTELSTVFARGNNGLADFLRPYEVPYVDVLLIDRAIDAVERAGFKIDDPIELSFIDGQLEHFTWFKDAQTTIVVRRTQEGEFVASNEAPIPIQQRFLVDTTIDGSFYMSLKRDGMADEIILEMARVLGFSLDFRSDIHPDNRIKGDVTCDSYTESAYFPEGLVTNCRTHYAHAQIGYRSNETVEIFEHFMGGEEDPVYLDPDGRSAANTILRVPVNGARLSSNFGGRRHPVLGTWRNHNGTDFAAPRGTPIYAAGDGVVERANRYGSFGNYVRIRHSGGYKTAYAHMSRFGSYGAGQRVRQGEIIGYVGTTGRSTGPHLHYEVYLDGRPIDSQRMDMPKVAYLEGESLEIFQQDIVGIRAAFTFALIHKEVDEWRASLPTPPQISFPLLPRVFSSRQLQPE